MFALRPIDLAASRILGCADGPASFNATLTARGGRVVSADPLYAFSADEIRSRVAIARTQIVANTTQNASAFRWIEIPSIEDMVALRLRAMECFLGDFDSGKCTGRYVPCGLPALPFADRSFDLVLCSHYLFLYSHLLSVEFHLDAIREMLRVGREVRVFPLLDFTGEPSAQLDPVLVALRAEGHRATLRRVPYEFLRGAHTMLVIKSE